MPEPITVNATTRRFLNERIRPLAERAKNIYAAGIELSAVLTTVIAELLDAEEISIDPQTGVVTAENPDTVLDDGRSAEGITQITTGDLALIINTLGGVVGQIAASPEIQSALARASVRPMGSGE
jgi:hypothetical protein